nr:hypothetical protein [Brachybacterium sp. Z12]
MRIASHDADGAVPFRDRVLEVWKLAFGPVEDEGDWRGRFWEQHRRRAGFRLVAAELEDELVGFGWGYTGERGQWWADSVAGALGADARKWVGGTWSSLSWQCCPTIRGVASEASSMTHCSETSRASGRCSRRMPTAALQATASTSLAAGTSSAGCLGKRS